MRSRRIGSLAALTLAAASAAALAQTPKPAPADKPAAVPAAPAATPPAGPPKPAAEMEQLKYFEGNWRCEGKAPAGPMGPEHAYKSTFKVKKDMDGFWYVADYEQKKAKDNPTAIRARGYFTWESGAKKFLFVGIDNMGGTITESSTGWEGDKMVSAGDGVAMGQKLSFRETYTKKSDKEMSWTGEMKMGKDWFTVGTDSCKK